MEINSANEFWSQFRAFKSQASNMDISSVREKTESFLNLVDRFYDSPIVRKEKKKQIQDEVDKILKVKKNVVTNNIYIKDWKLPSNMVPYVENGEDAEWLPKRYAEVFDAMMECDEFTELCNQDEDYLTEYDRWLVNFFSKAYKLEKKVVEFNMDNKLARIKYGEWAEKIRK